MRQGALSTPTSPVPASGPSDLVRSDDIRMTDARQPAGITPGSVLNIGTRDGQNHFLLQTAPDGAAAVESHSQLELAAGYEQAPYCTVNAARTAVQSRVSVGAATTGGSLYPRTEYREVGLDGAPIAFDALTGTHRMRAKFRVLANPTNVPDIVVMQLHNGSADRIAIRTQLVSGTLRLRCRINGTSHPTQLAAPYVLGTEFDVMLEVVDNTVNVYWATGGAALPASPQITQAAALTSTGSPSWYWKFGCYLQTNTSTDSPTDYGLVEHRDVTHWHTGWPANAKYTAVAQHAGQHALGGPDDISGSYVPWANVGGAGGVASLDAGGKIPSAQLPAIALTDYLVPAPASQAAMLALTGQRGDWTTRTDLGTDWQLIGDDPTQLANWRQMTYPASPVSSVNGRVGAVTGVQDTSGKDAAGGYAGLDAGGRLAPAEMPLVLSPVRAGTVSTSLTSDASSGAGNCINLTLTGNATIDLSTPADHQVITYHLLASGAQRVVTFGSSILATPGVRKSYTIPQGAVLVARVEYVGNRTTSGGAAAAAWLLTSVAPSDAGVLNVGPTLVQLRTVASQTLVTASAWTSVAWPTQEDFDTDGVHDLVTNNTRVTPPAGTYQVSAVVMWNTGQGATSPNRQIRLAKNGTQVPGSQAIGIYPNGGFWTQNIPPVLIACNGTDYIELQALSGLANSVLFGSATDGALLTLVQERAA